MSEKMLFILLIVYVFGMIPTVVILDREDMGRDIMFIWPVLLVAAILVVVMSFFEFVIDRFLYGKE